MTNFTVKNHFKAENAKLVDATTYKDENGTWYVELLYEYEDESGVHRRYYPKVEFPFFYGKLLLKDGPNSVKKICAQRAQRRIKDLWRN